MSKKEKYESAIQNIVAENEVTKKIEVDKKESLMLNFLMSILERANELPPELAEAANKLKEVYEKKIEINPLQAELFPIFAPQKSVELKKEFALNFGGLERIEKEYKHLLNNKLSSGLTLQQHIDKVRNWFNNLHGEDLGNWIKLFAYVKAVKSFSEKNKDCCNFCQLSEYRFSFSIKQNKEFFSYFIRQDKKTGQFTTKAKNKFLKWLYDNQCTIEFPIIANGSVWNIPVNIYKYAENVDTKEILLVIDTSVLDSEFKDYVSIKTEEIDLIADEWDNIAADNIEFAKYSLNNFVDIPLKFLCTLKNIYTNKTDYKIKDKKFTGNWQHLSKEKLNIQLGNLLERVTKHLIKRHVIRAGIASEMPKEIKRLILETAFRIAIIRGWLVTPPSFDKDSGVYGFNINKGYFDPKATTKLLSNPSL